MNQRERDAIGRLLASEELTETRVLLEEQEHYLRPPERETLEAIRDLGRRIEEYDAHQMARRIWRHRILTGDWISTIGGQRGPLESPEESRRQTQESISRQLLRAMAQEGRRQ